MKKRTRSILDELRNIGRIKDTEVLLKPIGSNIIESAINYYKLLTRIIPEQAQELERRFPNSIRTARHKEV